jgi:hypothetical protein
MITPLTLVSIERNGPWVQCKALAAASFEWTAGTHIDIAIPDPALVPHAVRSTWLASSKKEGFLEWMFLIDESPFVRHLLGMKQGDALYLKGLNRQIKLPDHGVWIASKEGVAILRGAAMAHQSTSNPIALVLYQTNKAYFADLTRVAGQNPAFHIHVANKFDELVAFVSLYPTSHFNVVAPTRDVAMIQRLLVECGIHEPACQFHGM